MNHGFYKESGSVYNEDDFAELDNVSGYMDSKILEEKLIHEFIEE